MPVHVFCDRDAGMSENFRDYGEIGALSRLAPREALPGARQEDAGSLGTRPAGGPAPRPRRQPPTAPTLAEVQRPQEASRGRRRRHRPRAGWAWSLAVLE